MRLRVQKWGNSLALRIPKPFAQDAEVREGTVVQVSVVEGRLIAIPLGGRKVRLKDLLGKITKANLHEEIASGPAIGREAW